MECTVTLTANAGVICEMCGVRFLLDALHDTRTDEFSSLDGEQTERIFSMCAAAPPQLMLVTHEHADHFSSALTARALAAFPGMRLVSPALHTPASSGSLRGDGYELRWAPLRHKKGAGVTDVPNFGYLLTAGGRTLFTAGDADPSDSAAAEFLGGIRPDIALLNFPWAATRAGKTALEAIAPRHLALFHLPFPQDDVWGYIPAAKSAAARLGGWDTRVLSTFGQKEVFDLAYQCGTPK